MRKFVLSICAILLLSVQFVLAQSQVKGVVTGAEGEPLAGVTVLVKGTQRGVVTDNSGAYNISVPKDAVLEFSFIGYESQEIPVGQRTTLNVQLVASATDIEDVVVVGYGTGRKIGTVVGSVAKVSADKLASRPSQNVMDAMQGQVAGLNVITGSGEPDAVSKIRLHGVGTITADAEPLVILDGAPVTTGTLVAMNPNDIESINVLKDASATSIYGSRAANGVIYVVTKRGRRGEDITVNLRTQYAMSSIVEPKITPMSTDQLTQYGFDLGVFSEADVAELRAFGNTDWMKEIFKSNVPMVQTDLSVQGGSEKTSFLISGSYSDQEGVAPGSEMTRYTFRSNVETQATKWLKAGMNLGLGYHKSANTFDVDLLGGFWPTLPAAGAIVIPHYQQARDPETGELYGTLPFAGDFASPLVMDSQFPTSKNRLQLNGNMFVEVNPVENLTLRSSLSANAFDYRNHSATSPAYKWSGGSGNVTEAFQRNYNWTLTNTAEYKLDVAKDHNLIFLLGQESIFYDSEYMSMGMNGISDSRFIYLNQGTSLRKTPTYELKKSTFNSIFGRVDYNFKEKYFFDLSLRDDASSKFSKDNRHAFFYAVGAMWNMKKEDFLKDSKALSQLSLKASYGTSGNSGIGEYDQYATLTPTTYFGNSGWALDGPGNPDLTWETQKLLTVGVNTELFNCVRIGLEYYNRTTDDMLMKMPIPLTTGFKEQVRNVGSMRNSGIDLTINADIFKNKDWYINVGATFNYNKNQFTKLFNGLDEYSMAELDQIYKIGSAYGTYYMMSWAGVNPETGYPQWIGADGGIVNSPDEAVYMEQQGKSWIPVYSGGANLTVSWKGLALSANIAWEADKWLTNNTLYFSENIGFMDGSSNQTTGALDYWKKPGDRATYPDINLGMGAEWDSHLLENASFLRLKNVMLSYDLPAAWMKRTKVFKGIRVYVSGRNLLTATKFRGIDPEIAADGDRTSALGDYPNTRQWAFGLDLKF